MVRGLRSNKGFTLIELLAVITILIVIMSIAMPSIVSLLGRTNEKILEKKYEVLENAAREYVYDNYNDIVDGTCYIPVEELTKYGYVISEIEDNDNGYLKDVSDQPIKGFIERKDSMNTPLNIDDDSYEYVSSYSGDILCKIS